MTNERTTKGKVVGHVHDAPVVEFGPVFGPSGLKAFVKDLDLKTLNEDDLKTAGGVVIGYNRDKLPVRIRAGVSSSWLNLVCGETGIIGKWSHKAKRWYLNSNKIKEYVPELPRVSKAVAEATNRVRKARATGEEKRLPSTTVIKCVDCGAERTIKVQDAFQVTRCVDCQKEHRRQRRSERRKEKKAEASG